MRNINLLWVAPFFLPVPWLASIATICFLSGAGWHGGIAFYMSFGLAILNWFALAASGFDETWNDLFPKPTPE